jgi:hypothetical protein
MMPGMLHLVAGLLAPLCIAVFLCATLSVELFGSETDVARGKSLIVTPGLWVLVPVLAATGASGTWLSRFRGGQLLARKKQRMKFIAANGLLILVPCALALEQWAGTGQFHLGFVLFQGLELLAGTANLGLLLANARDGLRVSGRLPGLLRSGGGGK